jgi:hypothetical protein
VQRVFAVAAGAVEQPGEQVPDLVAGNAMSPGNTLEP